MKDYYKIDQSPYYGPNITKINFEPRRLNSPPGGIIFQDPMGRYGNFDIYEKDQKPYYGNIIDSRKINKSPYKLIEVPIIIGDLEELNSDKKNKINQSTVNRIKKINLYRNDPQPYYDATILEKDIEIYKKEQMDKERRKDMKYNRTNIVVEKFKDKIKIQNYGNADKEENNKIITGQYHSSTDQFQFPNMNYTIFYNKTLDKNTSEVFANIKNHYLVEVEEVKNKT